MSSRAVAAEPIAHHATYELSVESTTYTVSYDWSEVDHIVWDFLGAGIHTERILTDYCFARVLSPKWAVIVRLPNSFFNNPNPIPEILLFNPKDTDLIRCYKEPEPGRSIDGLFSLISFSQTSQPGKRVNGQMSGQERQLIRNIDNGKYATLYGIRFNQTQWKQSSEIAQKLETLHTPTLLGNPAARDKPNPQDLKGFFEFNSQFMAGGKKGVIQPNLVLFVCNNEVWTESSASVAIYKRNQFIRPYIFAPFPIVYKGLKFELTENSLYYDADTGCLSWVLARNLDSLSDWVFENPFDS